MPETLTPEALLDALLALEQVHGRARSVPNAPRTLDLDLVLFGDECVATPWLTVPILGPWIGISSSDPLPRLTRSAAGRLWDRLLGCSGQPSTGPRTLELVAQQWC